MTPPNLPHTTPRRCPTLLPAGLMLRVVTLTAATLLVLACHHERPERLPGETDIVVSAVNIQSARGESLALPHAELFMLLGLRTGSLLVNHRYFSEFRLAEDRRRLVSWWQSYGYFDVQVSEPKLDWAIDKQSVAVTWSVTEGAAYHIGSVRLQHVPARFEAALRALVPFEVGDPIDLEEYRLARLTMAEHLQRQGYGHAKVVSRTFVDKKRKLLHWYYYADPGPLTRIGKIEVEGAHRLPEDSAIARSGLVEGEPYSLALKEKAELDLVDSGSYASAAVKPDADVDRVLPGDRPDTGGDLSNEQVDAAGNLVPRKLPDTVDMRLVVVEAPRTQLRLRAGAEADPSRGDAYFGARLWLRDVFGPFHHLVLDGRVGYGASWKDEDDELSGPYGEALVRYIKSGLFGRIGDFRLSGRYRDLLYPGFQLREVAAGPGIRSTLAPGVFLELDTLVRYEDTRAFGAFAPAVQADFDLSTDATKVAELDASFIWDKRNDPIEPSRGHLVQLSAAFAPGGALGSERYVRLDPELRGFASLNDSWSLGARLSGAWVLADDGAVPTGVRTFGGGAFGHRGFGRLRLSPEAPCVAGATCSTELVGGKSLLESTLELRFLPFRKPFGLAVFGDVGGAGKDKNPLADGLAVAVGFGPRLRLWYLPISLDFSVRLLNRGQSEAFDELNTYLVFLRIGEAF